MRRLLMLVAIVTLCVSATLWLLGGSTFAADGNLGDEEPVTPTVPSMLDLETAETGGADAVVEANGDQVGVSSHLTDTYVMPNYVTAKDLVSRVAISKSDAILGEGYYFLANVVESPSANFRNLLIVNDQAQLVYYETRPALAMPLADFKRQPDGTLTYYDNSAGTFNVMDNTYALIETWTAGNGFDTDTHDFQVLANGNVVFMIYDFVPVDMTSFGGRADAQVIDLVLQEMDPDHNVVFEWNSRDHFTFTDTYVGLNQAIVDYSHGNAIEEDTDGNFLISNRHMSEITKIDRNTGDIIWRLGGKNNEFTYVGDTELPGVGVFSYQHDIRRLPNGHITIFDNGNQFISAAIRGSRGVEYEIDEVNKTLTFVQEFRTVPETYATFMGNMQHLANGNRVIGWGGRLATFDQPIAVTEFSPGGDVELELSFLDPKALSYRAFKFPWQGFPTTTPALVAVTDTTPISLYYSWNGATEVVSYTVFGGKTPDNLAVLERQTKTDFEDSTALGPTQQDFCFFQVVPSMLGNAVSRASELLYLGDDACTNGLSTDGSTTTSKSFTYPQSNGNVTTTLTILPGGVTSPTIFVHIDETVGANAVPIGMVMSNVHFEIEAFQGEELSSVSTLSTGVQLSVNYGSLDLFRSPADIYLLRWDETTQSWTDEGLTLLQRDGVSQRIVYALQQTGEFALFATNLAPQSAAVTTLVDEDESFAFSSDLFPYFDLEGDTFAHLIIETLPVSGFLTYSGTPVTVSQVITTGSMSSLVFRPQENESGLPYTSFLFRVSDGFTQSVPYTLTISVKPALINAKPVAASVLLLIDEDELLTFSDELFPYFDPDGDAFTSLVVETLPVSGSLTYSGTPLVPFQAIPAANLSLLVFAPAKDEFRLPYSSFTFRVSDGFTQSVSYSLTIAVGPVNDEPVAVDDVVISLRAAAASHEDALASTVSIPVLANDSDVDGDGLRIVSVTQPAHGTVLVSGELIVYTSTDLFDGTDSFTYTIDDGQGGQATGTVSVQRNPQMQFLPRVANDE